jgi:hypothetical protein
MTIASSNGTRRTLTNAEIAAVAETAVR